MIDPMRAKRAGGKTADGRFKTLRSYIADDGMTVRKLFVSRKGETQKSVCQRADGWVAEMRGKLPSPSMKLSRAVDLYLEDREEDDIAADTLRDDKYAGAILKDLLGEMKIDAVDPFAIERGLKVWKDKPRTAKKVRDFGRKLYKWLAKREWSEKNPFPASKAPKYAAPKWQDVMSAAHFDKALQHVKRADYRAILL